MREELKGKKPKEWRRQKIKKIMDHGDCETPFLYNLPALQKASQDQKNKELGIQKGVSVIDSLLNLSVNV